MQIPDEVRLVIEGMGILGSASIILLKLGRMGERFDHHSTTLKEVKKDVSDVKDALQTVAVQKEAITAIREQQITNTKRTDETFTRVFAILDRMQQR